MCIVIQNIVDVKFLNIFFIFTYLDIKFLLIDKNSIWYINSLWSVKIFNSIIFNDLYMLFKDYIELIYGEGNGTPLQCSCLENPWMEEPGRLQTMGSRRVGRDWTTSLSLFTFMHWRRQWQPTPVFLPGESQGWGSLVGCHLWGRTESDTTEAT